MEVEHTTEHTASERRERHVEIRKNRCPHWTSASYSVLLSTRSQNLLDFYLKYTLITQILQCCTTAVPRCSHSASGEPELQITQLLPPKFHLGISCSGTVYVTIPIVLWIKVQPKILTLFVKSCLLQTNLPLLTAFYFHWRQGRSFGWL